MRGAFIGADILQLISSFLQRQEPIPPPKALE